LYGDTGTSEREHWMVPSSEQKDGIVVFQLPKVFGHRPF